MNNFKKKVQSVKTVVLSWTLVLALVASLCGFSAPAYVAPAYAAPEEEDADSLDSLYASFENPPYESKSRPLWFWNSNLSGISKGKITEIMEKSKDESGYAGFGILPNWLDNYLSDGYLDLYEHALEVAEELGMKMCLYDENGFPSGPAGGIIQRDYPEHTLKRLDKTEKDVTGPGDVALALPTGQDRTYLGAVAMNTETKEIIDVSDKAVFPTGDVPGVSASSEYDATGYTAAKAFDGDYGTRWNAASSLKNDQWLEVCFESAKTVDKFIVREAYDRITGYAVQYFDETSESWTDLATGSAVGTYKEIPFTATSASKFRFFMHSVTPEGAENSATIWEIELYDGATKLATPTAGAEVADHIAWTAPNGTWKVMAFASVRDGRNLVDYLSEDAVDKFIECTHEAYFARFPQYFGTVIDSAFYDEPPLYHASGRTWTGSFNDEFYDTYGYNPIKLYPALWYDIGEDTAAAKNTLFGFRTELFATKYIKNMNDWCNAHGIRLTGHIDQEENVNPVTNTGDLMKVFKYQDIPGVDEIISYDRALKAYKIVSSSANNWDKGKVMTETYGAMGEGMGVPVMYKDIMNQLTRGINLVVPHALWYDDNAAAIQNPPELSYRSEQYGPELPAYNEFIGRATGLLQDGRHVSDIGVLYPINTLQAGTTFDDGSNPYYGRAPAEADYMELGEYLMSSLRKDYTFLHPEVLADDVVEVDGPALNLNNTDNFESYKVFIMPGAKTISVPALRKIKEFYDAGGQVIATSRLPYQSAEIGESRQVKDMIMEMFGVTDEQINPVLPDIRYSASGSFNENYGPEKAFDGVASDGSRWNAADLSYASPQWLQVDFAGPVSVNKVVVKENPPYRVGSFKVEYWNGSSWSEAASVSGGVGVIGAGREITFDAVSASKMRLYIDPLPGGGDSASIQEFEVYGEGGFNLAVPANYLITHADHTNAAGGRAVYLGTNYKSALPQTIDEMLPVSDVTVRGVPGTLAGGSFTYIHKVKDDRDLYYFVNSGDSAVDADVALRGELSEPMLWDPHTGQKAAAEFTTASGIGGQTVTNIRISLDPVASVFIVDGMASETEGPDTGEPVDTTALLAEVEEAAALYDRGVAALLTPDGLKRFEAAYDAAVEALHDPDATPAVISAALNALETVRGELGLVPADKAALKRDVDESAGLKQSDYTDAGAFAAFKSAYETAVALLGDPGALQVEANRAVAALQAARIALNAKQKSSQALVSAIAAYRAELASLRSGYVASDVQTFENTLDWAAGIAASPDATQGEYDSALATLQDRRSTLRRVADKTALSATISKAGAVVTKYYTKKSVSPFTLALNNAKAVNGDASLSVNEQSTVNAADARLKAAMSRLVYNVTKMTVTKSAKNKLKKLKKGKSFQLKVSVTPKAIQKQVKLTYKTSNKKVATVSKSGKIKAKKKGKATITIAAPNGRKLKVKVTVK